MIELRTNERDWLASSPDDKIAVEPTEKGWRLFSSALTFINRAWDWTVDTYDPTNVKYLPIPELAAGSGLATIGFRPDRSLTFMDTPHLQVIKRDGKDGRARMIETICFFRWVELSSATIEDALPWQSASKGKGYRNKRDKAND